jgi:hypothetical protein
MESRDFCNIEFSSGHSLIEPMASFMGYPVSPAIWISDIPSFLIRYEAVARSITAASEELL